MGDLNLRAATGSMSRTEYRIWFNKQIRRVLGYSEWLLKFKGVRLELSENSSDIVQSTIENILAHKDNYIITADDDFDKFFGECLFRTIEAMRSRESAEKRTFDRPDYVQVDGGESHLIDAAISARSPAREIEETALDRISLRQYGNVVRNLIQKSGLRGAAKAYGERMGEFAERDLSKKQIAEVLGVSDKSVDKLRQRVGSAVQILRKAAVQTASGVETKRGGSQR